MDNPRSCWIASFYFLLLFLLIKRDHMDPIETPIETATMFQQEPLKFNCAALDTPRALDVFKSSLVDLCFFMFLHSVA